MPKKAKKRSASAVTKKPETISKRQWERWSDGAKALFWSVYRDMLDQTVYNPNGPLLSACTWKTVRHNAAFMAASAYDRQKKAVKFNPVTVQNALDTLAVALADKGHTFTVKQRQQYERATAHLTRAAA